MRVDPITRGWAVVTSAGVVRLGLGLIASLVIARALGPADFGVYAVLAATVGIVGTLAEGGLTEAAVLRLSSLWATASADGAPPTSAATASTIDDPRPTGWTRSRAAVAEIKSRAEAFFWLRVGLAAGVVGLGCLLAGVVSERLLNGVNDGLLRWALLGITATAASGAVSAMLQASGAFGRMSSLVVINTGLTAVLALALAALQKLNIATALIVLGIGTSIVTLVAGSVMLPAGLKMIRVPKLNDLRTEAKQLSQTGRWLWLASLFAMLTANGEVLLLNRWVALPLVGAYALALNLASKADLANQSLYTVLLPGVARLEVGGPGRVKGYMRTGLLRSAGIGAGLLLLIPLVQPFILLVYGNEFAEAVVFLRLLLLIAVFDVLLTPLLLLPLAYRQPKVLAAGDAMRAVTLLATALALIPTYGAMGAIVARLAARVGGAALVLAMLYSGRQALEIEDKKAASVLQ